MDPLDDVCVCGHARRNHMAHGRPDSYDTCLAGLDGSSVCPCMRFVKAAKQPEQ
jgi:hypothetical protein